MPVLNNQSKNNSASLRKPPWIRVRLNADGHYTHVAGILRAKNLHTVCESAQCPNRVECFNRGTATVMILGETCTRNCRFCAVPKGTPQPLDPAEPEHVEQLVQTLRLRHVVITSVTRDDLPDGGAAVFAETIRRLKRQPKLTIEVLTPDLQGKALHTVLAAAPDVFNHNLETIRRLQPLVRPLADYQRSLAVLREAAQWEPKPIVKSGLMLGMGETDAELEEALDDLRNAGCICLTIGQYLAPSRTHWPIARYVRPDEFESYRQRALAKGFRSVSAGALVRSSYRAEDLLAATNETSRSAPC